MKKTIAVLIVCILVVSAAGCACTASGEGSYTGVGAYSSEPAAADACSDDAAGIQAQEGYGEEQAEYVPGQLTAGEWNDNTEFEYFTNLMRQDEWCEIGKDWGYYNFERIAVKVSALGGPVQNASVSIFDEESDIWFEAKTDNKGMAYLFPMLSSDGPSVSGLSLVATYNGEIRSADIEGQKEIEVEFDKAADISDDVDIMFTVDTTGSMSDELEYLKAELKEVISRVENENEDELNIRVSVNFYRDYEDEYLVLPFPFSSDIDEAVRNISEQSADGGVDYPEAVTAALMDSILAHDWNEDARARLLFLVLDAPPHYSATNIEWLQIIIEEAAWRGINIIPVASSGVDKETEFLLRFLSLSTNGTYIFLTDDSGIGDSHIEPTIGDYKTEYLDELLVRIINERVALQ